MQKSLAAVVALGALSTISLNLKAQKTPPLTPFVNTKVNRSKAEPAAELGKNTLSDRDLMQKIRRSLMGDKSLSTFGKSVKIIAQKGEVTLEGPVVSEEEKCVVEEKATEIAGSGNVANEMSVKPAPSSPTKRTKPTS